LSHIWDVLLTDFRNTPRGAGVAPFRLCSSLVYSLIHRLLFITFFLFLFLIHFTYFLLLPIPSLSTRIVPLHFQAGDSRRRPNLGLVCFVYYCAICIAYLTFILVFYCIWFSFVLQCDSCLPLL